MKRLGVFLLPQDGMLVHHRSLPHNLLGFPNNLLVPIYTPGWREVLWEWSVLPKNTTQCPCPGFEPGPLDLGTRALTMRSLRYNRQARALMPHSLFSFFVVYILPKNLGGEFYHGHCLSNNFFRDIASVIIFSGTLPQSQFFHGHCLSHFNFFFWLWPLQAPKYSHLGTHHKEHATTMNESSQPVLTLR